jgi:hypothetical protein
MESGSMYWFPPHVSEAVMHSPPAYFPIFSLTHLAILCTVNVGSDSLFYAVSYVGLLANKINLEGNTILGKEGGEAFTLLTFHVTLMYDLGVASQFHAKFVYILAYLCLYHN